ncbi:MAG: hypothetical protein QOD74_1902 [Variibacter sp.]|jgi:uncharacterized membrane protein|nr:hypothetical protein [Variibacter sp.]
MRTLLFAAALSLAAGSAWAQGSTCKGQATDKKLHGAALNSFMKKCEGDARKSCEADTKDK